MTVPFGNTNGKKWTAEHDVVLRALVATNEYSYAGIAAEINTQFGTTYSRNSAIGRAHRLGLVNSFKVKTYKRPEQPKAPKNKPRARIIANNGNSNSMRVIESVERVAAIRLRCVEIIPLNITLLELKDSECRYIGGDSALYCGHPAQKDSSYCTPHHALTHIAPATVSDEERERRSTNGRELFRLLRTKLDLETIAPPDWSAA